MANLGKITSTFLAALIGGLSVLAGGSVLLKITVPNYQFLEWLVVYNVVLGGASLFVAFKLWQAANYKLPTAIFISHITVFVLLLTVFFKEVASDSLRAMSFRMLVWSVILLIIYLRNKNEN
ncbi:MAG: hypothetical protein L3J06_05020 [Cyclobacteriaceae bacterium]|nr:hypothetical protein [Cyclobacteriaceae bacterium]